MRPVLIRAAFALASAALVAQASARPGAAVGKESPAARHASGTFDVKLLPLTGDAAADPALGRMSIDKQFHGDLEAVSRGQMLTAGTDVKGSAGYVAMEKVSGNLQGRSGTFVLQHTGTMDRGVARLTISVVPDSGTGGLKGLAGNLTIDIRAGKHFFSFDYSLPQLP